MFCAVSVQVEALFGPGCDFNLSPVARYAPHYNVPVLSAGGSASEFGVSKTTDYRLLTRTGVTFNDLVSCLRALLASNHWNNLAVSN